jgi:membrane dipeptidase
MAEVSLEAAQEVHDRCLIIDGHNDTPVEHVARGERPMDLGKRDPAYHMDIPRMHEGGFDAGFFIIGNGPTANIRVTLEQTLASVEQYPDDLMIVKSTADVLTARDTGKIGVILTIEGAGRWLEGELDILGLYHRLGIRCIGITHGEGGDDPVMLQSTKSPFGPCEPSDRETERREAGGLTEFGKAVLKESNRRGIITDLAHINDKAFYEVLEHSALPVTMTHTAAFSLCNHWRCLTDDQLKALAQTGGVMGVAFVPGFIHPEGATPDHLAKHIAYVADLVGIEHIAVGSDYDGMGRLIPIVEDVSKLVLLTQSMLKVGLSEEDIQKVWGGNFFRLLKATIDPS